MYSHCAMGIIIMRVPYPWNISCFINIKVKAQEYWIIIDFRVKTYLYWCIIQFKRSVHLILNLTLVSAI